MEKNIKQWSPFLFTFILLLVYVIKRDYIGNLDYVGFVLNLFVIILTLIVGCLFKHIIK